MVTPAAGTNAGILNGNTLQNFPLADWQQIIDVNLTGTFLGMQAAVEPMIAAGGGSIINISSVEGLRGSPWLYGYVASKFGVRGLAKAAALELAPHHIRVNSIHPGLIRTPMTGVAQARFDKLLADCFTPINRWGTPEDVGRAVATMASGDLPFTTGAAIQIDGGTHIHH